MKISSLTLESFNADPEQTLKTPQSFDDFVHKSLNLTEEIEFMLEAFKEERVHVDKEEIEFAGDSSEKSTHETLLDEDGPISSRSLRAWNFTANYILHKTGKHRTAARPSQKKLLEAAEALIANQKDILHRIRSGETI